MPSTSDNTAEIRSEAVEFGPFRCVPSELLLLEDGVRVKIGSHALEVLIVLLENAGVMCPKETIMERVWRGSFVEESTLRVHIAGLRKSLKDGSDGRSYIVNAPNRGYGFMAPVRRVGHAGGGSQSRALPGTAHRVPSILSRTIGREEVVQAVVAQVENHRIVTIVGSGGIGKTTVALSAAGHLLSSYGDGASFVDFSTLAPGAAVGRLLATTLGVRLGDEDPVNALANFFRNRKALLVLDNCEHVVQNVADLCERLLRATTGIKVLATSREALRAESEVVLALEPLSCPQQGSDERLAGILRYPAVELFVERSSASLSPATLSEEDGDLLADVCRRLDGIPLAIELAAARVATFGLQGLAARLDDRFSLLTRGRRMALPRHQTLRATLDWSYDLLSQADQIILRRLAIFAGSFSEDAVCAVIADAATNQTGPVDPLGNLIAQSLVVVNHAGTPFFRLLETTRVYAREKLDESGETEATARRHAQYYRQLFERLGVQRKVNPAAESQNTHRLKVDNVEAALTWAYGPTGDPWIGLALTVAAVPLWLQLSMVNECRTWVELGLSVHDQVWDANPEQGKSIRMRLHAALGWPSMYDATEGLQKGVMAWKTTLELASELGDRDYQMRALWALWADRINHGECAEALLLAFRFQDLAGKSMNLNDHLVGERLTGTALHFIGDQTSALRHIRNMIQNYSGLDQQADVVRYQFDQEATARMTLSRVLWVQGRIGLAFQEIDQAIKRTRDIDHTFSLCNVLAQGAGPVALLAGDLTKAADYATLLRSHASVHSMDVWSAYADGFAGEVLVRTGQVEQGLVLLNTTINTLRRSEFVQYLTAFLGALAQGLQKIGRQSEAMAAVDEALDRSRDTGERWYTAELFRLKGGLLSEAGEVSDAEQVYRRSLELARSQSAFSWEVRTSIDLAKLVVAQGRKADAFAILSRIAAHGVDGYDGGDFLGVPGLIEKISADQLDGIWPDFNAGL